MTSLLFKITAISFVIVDDMKNQATKKKGRGFGAETHAGITEYDALEGTGSADGPQR